MRDRKSELERLGAEVLVVDPHEPYRVRHMLKSSGEGGGLSAFPILADTGGVVSALYGVAMQMRIHGEWSNRPATFVIDRSGAIRYAHLATTYSDRPGVEKLMEVLRRLAGVPEPVVPADLPPGPVEPEVPSGTFSREDLLGEVSKAKSGYSLVTVFHPSCSGCLTEAVALEDADSQWKELEVAVIGLGATSSQRDLKRFAGASRARFRLKPAPWAGDAFQVKFYPTLLILDRKGEEVFRAAEDSEDPIGSARKFLEERLRRK